MKSRDLLHFFATQLADQRLTDGSRLRRDTSSVPDVHLDKTGRFDPFDINGVTVIENREMRAQTRGLDDLSQMRHRKLAQRHALHRLATETQHPYAKRVVTGFNVTMHVATTHERAQQVTGRALRHLRRAADLRRAEAVASAREEFQNRERPFN